MGRVLGIDYGTVRIGLAVSDPLGMLATPLETLEGGKPRQNVEAIAEICRNKEITKIVVGRPLNMDGSEGSLVPEIDAFMDRLTSEVTFPVISWDERMTSLTAERGLREAGAKQKRKKELVDQVAAQIILQHYLDSQDGMGDL